MTMTQHKDLKRIVRARMKKTGESYTAARAQITRKPVTTKIDYAALAGMSDASIREKTGCTWERWVKWLDRNGAEELSHREIAKLVSEKFKVGPWWSQTVTVGYERIKGLRARGQRRDGSYGISKSRTFNVPIGQLFDAWRNDKLRARWLAGATTRVRTATKPKSLRLDWNDTIIAVGFVSKGNSRSAVALEHAKLPDRETASRLKHYWSGQLDSLGKILSEEGALSTL
jgi:hypothetical protein